MVPSSSEDLARALREQPRLSLNCLRRNGGNVIVAVLISFHSRDVFSAFNRPFVWMGFRLLFTRLAVHYLGAYSVSRILIKQTLLATATTVEPRFNDVAGDWPNLFVKWRVRYIENLDITNLRGNDQNVRYIEVIVND